MLISALATVAIAGFAWTLWQSSEKSWRVARHSADVAERALVASRRAWLSIENLKIIHPTEITEGGARIRVSFTVKNFGQTPAIGVWLNAAHWFYSGPETYVSASEKFVAGMRNVAAGIFGPIMFPNEAGRHGAIYLVHRRRNDQKIHQDTGNRRAKAARFHVVCWRVL